MAEKRVLVQFEVEMDEADLAKLMPNAIKIEDGRVVSIDPHASMYGPLGDGIVAIVRGVTDTFSFGPYGILDVEENAERLAHG
jgi:hypothetical protein